MGKVTLSVIDRAGRAQPVLAEAGSLLMHVLRDQVDGAIGICGGEMSCGTCLVRLGTTWLGSAAGQDERDMLEALGAGDNDRLACQIVLQDDADGAQVALLHEE